MINLRCIGLFLLFVLLLVLTGCNEKTVGNSNSSAKSELESEVVNKNAEQELEKKPVTLKIMTAAAIGNFEEYWKPLIEEKLPHITIEYMEGNAWHADHMEELVAANNIPDIVFGSRADTSKTLKQFELGFDMSQLIGLHDFDLSRFDSDHLQGWTSWSDGEIWMLPFMMDLYALHYNKDIFDLFGVPYPTDDMTWDEVINLARQVTGVRDGVQYRGLHMADVAQFPLSQVMGETQFVDPETLEVSWTENPFVIDFLEKVEAAHTIQGNEFPEVPGEMSPYGAFIQGTLAMLPRWLVMPSEEDSINWDMVTYPQWEEQLGIGPNGDGWGLGITASSEHKEEAFEVLQLLYSEEHIMDLAQTPLHAAYPYLHESGQSIEHLNEVEHGHIMDKNLESLSKLTPAGAPATRSSYDSAASNVISQLAYDYLNSEKDINTFLREVHEREVVRVLEESQKE